MGTCPGTSRTKRSPRVAFSALGLSLVRVPLLRCLGERVALGVVLDEGPEALGDEEELAAYGGAQGWAAVQGIRQTTAREVLDRALAKATTRVEAEIDHRQEGPPIDTATMIVALALVAHRK